MRAWFAAVALLFAGAPALAPAYAHEGAHASTLPPWQQASAWPDRVVVTFAADPARTLAVSWRTNTEAGAVKAEIVEATPDARFDQGARAVTATSQTLKLTSLIEAGATLDVADNKDLPDVRFHSVVFDGLQPDTLYAYRVEGAKGEWSEWFQTRTAPLKGPVSFLYLGDAQNGIYSHWARTIRAAYAKAPDAAFVIHAGDLVNRGSRDLEWAQWFKSVGFIHAMMPAIPVAGNHEYPTMKISEEVSRRILSILWRPQFALPEEVDLPALLKETVYSVRYTEDLEVFVLDSNTQDLAPMVAWLDRKLAASTARWKVATMHHPVYSSGRDRDNPKLRDAMLPVLRKHQVDLVLQGHDHTYARGDIAQQPDRFSSSRGGKVESVFVNSVSGPKQYEFSKDGWTRYQPTGVRLRRKAENAQFFQLIRIDGGKLAYEAWTADGQLYDAFTLEKNARGEKTLKPGTVAMAERTMKTGKPYKSTDDIDP
jgi:predicted phosphodiesterase